MRWHLAPISLLQILTGMDSPRMVGTVPLNRRWPVIGSPDNLDTGHCGTRRPTTETREKINCFHRVPLSECCGLRHSTDRPHESLLQVGLPERNAAFIRFWMGLQFFDELTALLGQCFALIHQVDFLLREAAVAGDFLVLVFHFGLRKFKGSIANKESAEAITFGCYNTVGYFVTEAVRNE